MEFMTIPIMRLNGPGYYPGQVADIVFRATEDVKALVRYIQKNNSQLGVFYARDSKEQSGKLLGHDVEVYPYGVLMQVMKITPKDNDRLISLSVAVTDRIELLSFGKEFLANVWQAPWEAETLGEEKEAALKEMLRDCMLAYLESSRNLDGRPVEIRNPQEIESMSWFLPGDVIMGKLMGAMEYVPEDVHAFLSCEDLEQRYLICMDVIRRRTEVKKIKKGIALEVRENLQERQRQAILAEQMHVIKQQMGQDEQAEQDEMQERLDALEASETVKNKIQKEINRLKRMPATGSEAALLANYIETALEYPWSQASEENTSIHHAREVMDQDHYGLDKVKERILEYLAVRNLTQAPVGSILCLVGPPGTGKTSVVQSVARALGRQYVRISLGGVHDESEIRGHRKTYVGAMPGRIVTAIKNAGVNNPVILLDELDKMGADSLHGNPADAMLEVLDAEQNVSFRDHFMEVPIDLSHVMFVATANDRSRIPGPLLDRLDIVEVDSYTLPEKEHIAERYLLRKQWSKNGLQPEQLVVEDGVLRRIIEDYTREAGVRELERKIATICRKTALKITEENAEQVTITNDNLEEFLGKPYHRADRENHEAEVGLVHGLAWTSVGGVVLDVEVGVIPGNGELLLTGHMGDVMKESARIALSLVKAMTQEAGLPEDYFEKHSFHIHIPEGAVPKDGPSAGITLTTALYSAVTGHRVRGDVAMTGEVTLRGHVLAIGGLREKLLAASLDGFRLALIPEENRRDLAELSEELLGQMAVMPVKTMEDVLAQVLCKEDEA